ncbi:MAG TPA: sigma-70 family RNA polymerase sigma factor [Nocardioides sp.]
MTDESPTGRHRLWSPAQRARLVRLCAAVSGDAAAAEDLAQEALLEAWRHQHRLTDPAGAEAWLNAVARNVCRRHLRSRGQDRAVPTESVPDQQLDALDPLEREEVVELLDRALGLLPPATRDALVGHYVDGLTHADLAEHLGTSTDAVSMRVTRGRRRLRHLLETELADDHLAEAWATRDSRGWRATRLACAACGRSGVQLRHDDTEVALRCPGCDGSALSARLPLAAPAFASLVGTVRRPTAIQSRLAAWTDGYWTSTTHRCVRCSQPITPRPYARDERGSWSSGHGWHAGCAACGEEVSSSVAGLVLSRPEVRAARRRTPALRALPDREVEHAGSPAVVVSLGTADGTPHVSAVVLRDSLRIVRVDTTA